MHDFPALFELAAQERWQRHRLDITAGSTVSRRPESGMSGAPSGLANSAASSSSPTPSFQLAPPPRSHRKLTDLSDAPSSFVQLLCGGALSPFFYCFLSLSLLVLTRPPRLVPVPAPVQLPSLSENDRLVSVVQLVIGDGPHGLVEAPSEEASLLASSVAMVAWRMTVRTPEYPDGRPVYILANDITVSSGSFSLAEVRAQPLRWRKGVEIAVTEHSSLPPPPPDFCAGRVV